jgi:hypothetical protein
VSDKPVDIHTMIRSTGCDNQQMRQRRRGLYNLQHGDHRRSLKMTPAPLMALELIGQARGSVCARLPGLLGPLPVSPLRGFLYPSPIAGTTSFIHCSERSLWILAWHNHCFSTPSDGKLEQIDGERNVRIFGERGRGAWLRRWQRTVRMWGSRSS